MTKKTLLSTAALLAALLSACGDDDGSSGELSADGGTPVDSGLGLDSGKGPIDLGTGPVDSGTGVVDAGQSPQVATLDGGLDAATPAVNKFFTVPTEIYTADFASSTSFVPIVPSLDVAEIPLNTAREVNGRASAARVDKWLFVASSSAPVVNRFEVDEQGKLVQTGSLNFMNYGVPEFFAIDDWGAVFVSPTKAYIFNGSDGSHVIWNPTTMTITGEIAGPGIVREGYNLESVAAVRGNRMYRLFTILNYDTWDFLPAPQYLVVYDLDKDTILSKTEESRCPQLYNRPFIDESGDIYFSGWVWTPAIALVKSSYPKSCALRVRAGQDVFDPDYKLDFGAQLTMGREAGVLRYLGNGKALLDVFHHERVTITLSTDPEELANTPNWRLWIIDLKTNTGKPLDGFDYKAGGYTDVRVDGRSFLMVPNENYSLTTAFDIVDGKAFPSFKIQGSSYNILRVR